MYTRLNTQPEGHNKRATHADWIQNMELGCLTQAGDLYRRLDERTKVRLVNHIVAAMRGVPYEIQVRQVGHFMKSDPAYGEAVAAALGMEAADITQAS